MTRLEVEFIAEVAQGFEGTTRNVAPGGSDFWVLMVLNFNLLLLMKFVPQTININLFKSLEMPLRHWLNWLASRVGRCVFDSRHFWSRSLTFAKKWV